MAQARAFTGFGIPTKNGQVCQQKQELWLPKAEGGEKAGEERAQAGSGATKYSLFGSCGYIMVPVALTTYWKDLRYSKYNQISQADKGEGKLFNKAIQKTWDMLTSPVGLPTHAFSHSAANHSTKLRGFHWELMNYNLDLWTSPIQTGNQICAQNLGSWPSFWGGGRRKTASICKSS